MNHPSSSQMPQMCTTGKQPMIPELHQLTRLLADMHLHCRSHYRWQPQPVQIQLILILIAAMTLLPPAMLISTYNKQTWASSSDPAIMATSEYHLNVLCEGYSINDSSTQKVGQWPRRRLRCWRWCIVKQFQCRVASSSIFYPAIIIFLEDKCSRALR